MTANKQSYATKLALIFFLTWGLIFLDRSLLSILLPLMIDDIALTNSQIGNINMWQTLCYAIASPVFAIMSDRLGKKKPLLFGAIVITGLLSLATMFATSFAALAVIRALLGAAEGIILPIMISIIAVASEPGKFGRNVGIVYAGAAVIASLIGPVVATQLGTAFGWQNTYLMISIPSLLCGLLIWKFVKNDVAMSNVEMPVSKPEPIQFSAIFKNRNIIICILISIFHVSSMWIILSYAPLYLTQFSNVSVEKMGMIMSGFGLLALFWQIFIPSTSDKIGRRPTIIFFAFMAALAPLALYLFPGTASIISFIFLGGIIVTSTSLFISIIPVESVPPNLMATASALIMGIGEIVAAFVVGIAGSLADSYGLPIVMLIAGVNLIVAAIIAIGLIETRKRKAEWDTGSGTLAQ